MDEERKKSMQVLHSGVWPWMCCSSVLQRHVPSRFPYGHFCLSLTALKMKPIQWTQSLLRQDYSRGSRSKKLRVLYLPSTKHRCQLQLQVQGSFPGLLEMLVCTQRLGASPALRWNTGLLKGQWIRDVVSEACLDKNANQHDPLMTQKFRQSLIC